jgi:hypothetical protein
METQLTVGKVVGHLIGWTILGFIVLLVIGPVIAIVGTILPFALVGFLTWVGYRAVRRVVRHPKVGDLDERVVHLKKKLAPGGEWNRAACHGCHRAFRAPGAAVAWAVPKVLRFPGSVVAWFARKAWRAAGAVLVFAGRTLSFAYVQGRMVAVIFLEVFCGIAVGGLLGALIDRRISMHGELVLPGAAIGAFLGVLVALSTKEPGKRSPTAKA